MCERERESVCVSLSLTYTLSITHTLSLSHTHSLSLSLTLSPSLLPSHRIRLNFAHFATECSWDHLYVHDGPGAFSPLLGIFSGLIHVSPHPLNPAMEYAPEILTSSNVAYLHFYSDAAYNMTGFSISYVAEYCDNGRLH